MISCVDGISQESCNDNFLKSDNLKINSDLKVRPATACISSISENELENLAFSNPYEYQDTLEIYPLYTKFIPDYCEKPFSSPVSSMKTKRGKIAGCSGASARRLKQRIGRAGDLDCWIDFTFPDDVMEKKTITERAEFSYYCMKQLMSFAKNNLGLHVIWKREYKNRKSGNLKGSPCPHFHCLIGGLKGSNYEYVCICLLREWVRLIGTKNSNALTVALHRKKNGAPSSYRKIENQKHAICYISKYFSKDNDEISIHDNESIGRCWGHTKNLPEIAPKKISLSFLESRALRAALIEKKDITAKKSGIYFYNALSEFGKCFVFDPLDDILELIEQISIF